MATARKELIMTLLDSVEAIAQHLVAEEDIHLQENSAYLERLFGITESQLCTLIMCIVDLMPSRVYLDSSDSVRNYFTVYLAQRFVFFLIQEDINSPDFESSFQNFKEEVLSTLINDIYTTK